MEVKVDFQVTNKYDLTQLTFDDKLTDQLGCVHLKMND